MSGSRMWDDGLADDPATIAEMAAEEAAEQAERDRLAAKIAARRVYGYARVSTGKQDTDAQRHALEGAGCSEIIEEQASGRRDRPALAALLDHLQPGDTLTVWRINRLARSVADLYRITELVRAKGATFRSLTESFDTSTPIGRAMLGLLTVLAQFEVEQTSENIRGGLKAAKARGKRLGRPPAVTVELADEIRGKLAAGAEVKELARIHRVDPRTIRRIRGQAGAVRV